MLLHADVQKCLRPHPQINQNRNSTLLRQRFGDDELAVRLFSVFKRELDFRLAALPVLHSGQAQTDSVLIQHVAFLCVLVAARGKRKQDVHLISDVHE